MTTESEKQAERDRVLQNSGFRVGMHDFLSEVDIDALRGRNNGWEADHSGQSFFDRKTEELIRIAAYVAMRNPVYHIQIHVHAAHQAGATPEEIYNVIKMAGSWAGAPPARTAWKPGVWSSGRPAHHLPRLRPGRGKYLLTLNPVQPGVGVRQGLSLITPSDGKGLRN